MSSFLLVYDLKRPHNHTRLVGGLRNAGGVRLLEHLWIFRSGASAEQIGEIARRHLNDAVPYAVLPVEAGTFDGRGLFHEGERTIRALRPPSAGRAENELVAV